MEAHTGMPRPTSNKPFDIKERTFLFSVEVVKWAKLMPRDYGTQVLLRQALRAATSIGANVEEADGATTEKDQVYKWAVARKEARETRYWLRLLSATATFTGSWQSRTRSVRTHPHFERINKQT